MKKTIAIFFFALLSSLANAGNWGVQYQFLTNHFADRAYEDWVEDTQGFALRYSFDSTWAVQAGHYRNEYSVRQYNFFTNYVGVDYTPWHYGPLHFGGYGRITSGYSDYTLVENPGNAQYPSRVTADHNAGLKPDGGLMVRVEYRQLNYTLRARPDLPGNLPAALISEVGWSFK